MALLRRDVFRRIGLSLPLLFVLAAVQADSGRPFRGARSAGGQVRETLPPELSAGIDVSISQGGGAEVLGIVPSG